MIQFAGCLTFLDIYEVYHYQFEVYNTLSQVLALLLVIGFSIHALARLKEKYFFKCLASESNGPFKFFVFFSFMTNLEVKLKGLVE